MHTQLSDSSATVSENRAANDRLLALQRSEGQKMSSQCPSCYVGLCKKHPLQDSGASLKSKGPANKVRWRA